MNAERLEAALRTAGIHCRVEARERLAILVPTAESSAAAASAWRRIAVRLAREHGFTHVALEVPETSENQWGLTPLVSPD